MHKDPAQRKIYEKEYWIKKKSTKPHLKRTYGITVDDYNDMFAFQDGKCKGCDIHQSELKTALHVDHDHKTGKIRGLLCRKCNTAIGITGDNITTLKTMINYLKKDE